MLQSHICMEEAGWASLYWPLAILVLLFTLSGDGREELTLLRQLANFSCDVAPVLFFLHFWQSQTNRQRVMAGNHILSILS